MFQIGVSYGSVIQDPLNMRELLQWDAQVVEFPLSDRCSQLKDQAHELGYLSALHLPSYELIRQMPYIMDMRTVAQVREYLNAIDALLQKDEGWTYLVAHYPIITTHTHSASVRELNEAYLTGLNRIAAKHALRLFLENVAVHPWCYLPESYDAAMGLCDGLCFDIGHAHSMDAVLFSQESTHDYVADFFQRFRQKIRCIHLYNATNQLTGHYSYRKHYPFCNYGAEPGFMDLRWLEQQILSLPQLEYVIHEPHRDAIAPYQRLDFGIFGAYKRDVP